MKRFLVAVFLMGPFWAEACTQLPERLRVRRVDYDIHEISGSYKVEILFPKLHEMPCENVKPGFPALKFTLSGNQVARVTIRKKGFPVQRFNVTGIYAFDQGLTLRETTKNLSDHYNITLYMRSSGYYIHYYVYNSQNAVLNPSVSLW